MILECMATRSLSIALGVIMFAGSVQASSQTIHARNRGESAKVLQDSRAALDDRATAQLFSARTLPLFDQLPATGIA